MIALIYWKLEGRKGVRERERERGREGYIVHYV